MSKKDNLNILRANSCYSPLRSLVDIVCYVTALPAMVGIIILIFDIFNKQVSLWSLLAAIGSVLALFIIICLRQAMLLLVDLADAQLAALQEKTASTQLLRQLLRAYQVEPEA